jgi:outer membrane protein
MKSVSMAALVAVAVPAAHAQSPAGAETLADAISAALASNPVLAAQRSVRGQADERLEQARSAGRPQVGLSGGYAWETTDVGQQFSLFGQTFPQDGDASRATAGIEARQPIYAGGSIAARTRQARAGVTAAEAQLEAARRDVILQVVAAFIDVRRAQEEVEIRQTTANSLATQVRAAQDRFDVGEVTRTDVAQAQARAAGAQADLAAARAGLEARRAIYEAVVGRPAGVLVDPPPPPNTAANLGEAVAAASAANAEVRAATAAEAAAQAAVQAARGDYRPRIDIVGTAGVIESYQDDTFRDTNFGLAAQLSVPLYRGGFLASRTREARLAADQARFERLALERQVRAQVTQLWHRVIAAREAIQASATRVDAAEIALEGAQQELSVGTRTTLDVLDQEQELLNARLGLINAEREAYVALHELLAVTGGLTPELFGR